MYYPGGKAKTFHHVINVMPPHAVYIEPFLGHGSVLRAKKSAEVEIGVDLDHRCVSIDSFGSRTVRLVQGCGVEFLSQYPFEGHEVVYCDPPYLPETRKRSRVYRWDMSHADHVQFLRIISTLNAKVIVSGYDSALYQEKLYRWSRRTFTAKAHDVRRQETLWFNYEPPKELHDYSYLGSDYRERQTIKRRIGRVKRRIEQLHPYERASLRDWLLMENNQHAD